VPRVFSAIKIIIIIKYFIFQQENRKGVAFCALSTPPYLAEKHR
jgi:hypothetical protein